MDQVERDAERGNCSVVDEDMEELAMDRLEEVIPSS